MALRADRSVPGGHGPGSCLGGPPPPPVSLLVGRFPTSSRRHPRSAVSRRAIDSRKAVWFPRLPERIPAPLAIEHPVVNLTLTCTDTRRCRSAVVVS